MHHVDLGPAPERLAAVALRHTPAWVRRYRGHGAPDPSDTLWRDFEPQLRSVFFGLCAYCERACKGEVDHIRPKSKFPELVYAWRNWAYACHDCNHTKSDQWPAGGLLDPVDPRAGEFPERFLEFNLALGEIAPRKGLRGRPLARAKAAIRVLDLNHFALLRARAQVLFYLRTLAEFAGAAPAGRRRLDAALAERTRPEAELSSLARAFAATLVRARQRAS